MEKCGKIWKNGCFSGRLRPDWGHTTRAAMAGLGSIGLIIDFPLQWNSNLEKMDFAMLRNVQGLHAPLRLQMERKTASRVRTTHRARVSEQLFERNSGVLRQTDM